MTVTHMISLKFKDNIDKQMIDGFFSRLYALREHTPGLLSFKHGSYQSKEGLNQGFTHAFIMEFDTEENRDNYLNHPKHQSLAPTIVDTLEDNVKGVIAFDFVEEKYPLTPRTIVEFAETVLEDSEGARREELQQCQQELQVLQNNIAHNPRYGIRVVGNRSFDLPYNSPKVESLLKEVVRRLEEPKTTISLG